MFLSHSDKNLVNIKCVFCVYRLRWIKNTTTSYVGCVETLTAGRMIWCQMVRWSTAKWTLEYGYQYGYQYGFRTSKFTCWNAWKFTENPRTQDRLQQELFCAAGITLTVSDLAEIYKVADPTELCDEEELKPDSSCGDKVNFISHAVETHLHKT